MTNLRKVETYILVFILFSIKVLAFSGAGDGTSPNPYQIENCLQLQEIRDNLNAHYILINNIDCSDTPNWNMGLGFTPIGNLSTPFSGAFNGNGYMISNLFINRANEDYVGLFGYMSDIISNVENVTLMNTNITGRDYVGGLAGYVYTTVDTDILKNINIHGEINGRDYIGGAIGYSHILTQNVNYKQYNDYIYTNCSISGNNFVGGLIGYLETYYSRYHYLRYSHTYSNVRGNNYVGGIIGYGNAQEGGYSFIESSFSEGTVKGNENVGGLAGYLKSAGIGNNARRWIRDSYSQSNITGYKYLGGLIGQAYNSGFGLLFIERTYSSGKISGVLNTGGLVGYKYSEYASGIYDSYNFWSIENSNQTFSAMGSGKTTNQMMIESTFSGWNFDNIWFSNADYPKLRGYIGKYRPKAMNVSIMPILLYSTDIAKVYCNGSVDEGRNIRYYYNVTEDSIQYLYGISSESQANINSNILNITLNDTQIFKTIKVSCLANDGIENASSWITSSSYLINPSFKYQGNGTLNNPYQVTDCYDLFNIRFNVAAYYELNNSIDCSNTLNWFNGTGFKPITPFQGSFDGRGNKISNLFINTTNNNTGIFGYVTNKANITNTTIYNSTIIGTDYVGAFIGLDANSNNKLNLNCVNSFIQGKDYVGGIIGYSKGYLTEYTYSDCYIKGNNYVGGIIGYTYAAEPTEKVYIKKSYTDSNIFGNKYVGGVIGYHYGNNGGVVHAQQIYSLGNVTGKEYIGGLIGYTSGRYVAGDTAPHFGTAYIEDSFSLSNIRGDSYIGGITSYLNTDREIQVYDGKIYVYRTYFGGNITNNGTSGGIAYFKSDIGVGYGHNYWDTVISGLNISAIGEGRNTDEMRNRTTFVTWDFDNIWYINEGVDYPRLLWSNAKCSMAIEICNGIDDDCDGSVDETYNVGINCRSSSNSCGDTNEGMIICSSDNLSSFCNALLPQERSEWNQNCTSLSNICGEINLGFTDCDGVCIAIPPQDPDIDQDNVADCNDNCINIYNPSQQDIDYDSWGDMCDLCPSDVLNRCDSSQTGASIINSGGGIVSNSEGSFIMNFPEGSVGNDTTFSVMGINPKDANFRIGSKQGIGITLASYNVEPTGTQFLVPVTITMTVNVSNLNEQQKNSLSIYVYDTNSNRWEKLESNCSVYIDMAICNVETIHLTTYGIVAFADLDNDSVPDNFEDLFDNCKVVMNPEQIDSDDDHIGDACDICPYDINNDEDKDGVCGDWDKCSETRNDNLTNILKPNHYADIDGDGIFETNIGNENNLIIIDSDITLIDTFGCTCQQILACKPGNNYGENNKGCLKDDVLKSQATMNLWIQQKGWASNKCRSNQ